MPQRNWRSWDSRRLWIPDVGGTSVLESVAHLLSATNEIAIATGILNLWMNEPATVAESYADLSAAHGDRFLLGIGVSHAPLIDAIGARAIPQTAGGDSAYLDALDNADQPVPRDARVLAALGPRMLDAVSESHPRSSPLSHDA